MFEIKVDTSELDKLFAILPSQTLAAVRAGIGQGLEKFRSKHTVENLRGRPGLILRHGRAGLGGAARTEVIGDTLADLRGVAFIGPPATAYARIQEFGGTVRPKRAKFLSVPAKGTGPDQKMRDFPGGSFIPRAKGGWYYVQGGKLRFILVREVHIPARLGWRKTWDEAGERFVVQSIGTAVGKMLRALNSGGTP